MISLFVWLGLLLGSLLIMPWAAARAARAVGSPRGTYRVAVGAIVLNFAANVVLGALSSRLTADNDHPILQAGLMILVSLAVQFVVFTVVFRLSFARTFAPVGACLAVNFAAVAVALCLLRPFVSESFVMPTHSMSPTIDAGDRFFANKLAHPRRFDLIVYWNDGIDHDRMRYCKRLIGLPGERLRFSDGGIFVNDQAVAVPAILAGRCRASIPRATPPYRRYEEGQTIVLGSNEYFFIGDNIDISADSRIYGPSDRSSLVGVVDLMYWPVGKIRVVR